jgi:mannose-6-phosphate isomerase-like protein (cupin superfamily)
MEDTMAERSVAWDTGEAISGTPFRHMIKAAGTGSRFSAQLAVVKAGELIIPHSHRDEDEFSFVFRGRIGGRVATTTWWLR